MPSEPTPHPIRPNAASPREPAPGDRGFSFTELAVVMFVASILAAIAVPQINALLDRYRLISVAQSISSQLQYARMKAVSSNEEIRGNFPSGQSTYQVESSAGTVLTGPFFLARNITWNAACGTAITFPGNYVAFDPTGNLPTSGNGSTGRVRITNQAGERIDIVVQSGGIIRQTIPYTGCTAPF